MSSFDNTTDQLPSSRRTICSIDEMVDTGKGYLWDRKRLQLENRKVKSQRILHGTGSLRTELNQRFAQSERTPLVVCALLSLLLVEHHRSHDLLT